jgi:myo-inositol-1(or 4)-monophosphatase
MDHRSEAAIISILTSEFPDCGILAEESDEKAGSGSARWILDPLDGTTNYAHGYPFFCISLAFEYAGEIVWGIVYDPLREEVFSGELGKGAALNGKPITVSSTDILNTSFLSTGFPYDVRESKNNNLAHFNNFATAAQAIRRDGSAALDLCYVAMGRFDGFWELKLRPWDTAAGSLIVTEAGGRVTDFKGNIFCITSSEILATNGRIHEEMVHVLSQGSG